YWPCSLSARRRAADSRSVRPVVDFLENPPPMAAWRAGAIRASARAIEPSDLRIAWTSLPTDIRRGLRKRASTADATDESYYAVADARRSGRSASPSARSLCFTAA